MNARFVYRRECGFVTIWMLGLCILVIFFAGISLDLWHGFAERRQLAAITDSAAIAAASQIDLAAFRAKGSVRPTLDPVLARQRALAYTEKQAKDANITLTRVDVSFTPQNQQVIVVAEQEISGTLTRIFMPGKKYLVSTTSTAEPMVKA